MTQRIAKVLQTNKQRIVAVEPTKQIDQKLKVESTELQNMRSQNLDLTQQVAEQIQQLNLKAVVQPKWKTGDIVLFSGNGFVSETIKMCQAFNGIPNELKITHVGMIYVSTQMEVYNMLLNNEFKFISAKDKLFLMNHLNSTSQLPEEFVVQATGSMHDILHGVMPFVQISPLSTVVQGYNGKVYIRQANKEIENLDVIDLIGVGYTTRFTQIIKLFEAPLYSKKQNNFHDKNYVGITLTDHKRQDLKKLFCSELVAYICKCNGLLQHNDRINVSAVIPEQLQPGDIQNDIVYDTYHDSVTQIK